jgi:hypothetical protein
MRQHWPRWIVTSIYKHFDGLKGVYPHYLNPLERGSLQDPTRFELRINGPDIHEVSNNYFRVDVDVNLLVQFTVDLSQNVYAHEVMIGQGLLGFTQNITIKKYGSGVGDDSSVVGCLQKQTSTEVINFGRVQESTNILHSTIDSEYRMWLQEN